jgi:multidrug efflux pump subunit AcrB
MVLALFLIPLLARASYTTRRQGEAPHADRRGWIDRAYVSTLPMFLKRPFVALLIALLLAGATVAAYLPIGTGFLPAADEGGFVIDYLPRRHGAQDYRRAAQEVEAILAKTRRRLLRPAHGIRARHVCDADEQRRRVVDQAAIRPEEAQRYHTELQDSLTAAGRTRKSSPSRRDAMLGDLEEPSDRARSSATSGSSAGPGKRSKASSVVAR